MIQPSIVGKRWIKVQVDCRRDTIGPIMQRLCEGLFVPRFAANEMLPARDVKAEAMEKKTGSIELRLRISLAPGPPQRDPPAVS